MCVTLGTARPKLQPLSCLLQHVFIAVHRREYDWLFAFDGQTKLVVECLWRLIEDNRICRTSLDDGQQYGLPAPVDAAKEVNMRLASAVVVAVDLREGRLDLYLTFNTGHVLEIIPDSSGYEAWNLQDLDQQFIAVGGGDLAVLSNKPDNRVE